MKSKLKKKPTPEELLVEVKGQEAAKTYEFEDYLPVVDALQKKGHSYADIAKIIQERLGITASRGQVYRAYQIWLEESRQAEEGIAQEERYAPEPTFQEEYEHRLYESAVALIDELRDRHAQGSNEPWTDPETLLGRAHGILAEERRLAEKAEAEAADADLLLEAKKGKKDASAK